MIESDQKVFGAQTPWRDCIIDRRDKPSYTGNIAPVAHSWTVYLLTTEPENSFVTMVMYQSDNIILNQEPLASIQLHLSITRGDDEEKRLTSPNCFLSGSELSCCCRRHSYQYARQQQPVLTLQAAV